ncbi:AAA family ATPase [Acidiferrimicrobium sp. IK]|uniref:AAA family ATPase n=1 Tax=Acidiferrimicrobium sp. IK TaxID=2871700 RepID=UPI0021CAFFAC|nr:AAA family ATPase [Acidiferrimicrobium sp. IK]MCU4186057.1 AAA family ATPase [Acidiferrimicrobium sp. IK]
MSDEDVDELLRELPGLEQSRAGEMAAGLDEAAREADLAVAAAREGLLAGLSAHGPFPDLVRSAGLDQLDAEVLALLCAVELDPRRQRLVGYLNDDVTLRRLTPWTLAVLLGRRALGPVAPGGALRRAALLAPAGGGPWAAEAVAVAGPVTWWLAGDRALDPALPAGAELLEGPGASDSTDPAPQPGAAAYHPVVVAAGPDRVRRLQAAVSALGAASVLVIPAPEGPEQWDAVIRWGTLADAGVVVEVDGALTATARDRIERAHHLRWALTSPLELSLASLPRTAWREVDVEPAAATQEEWEATFPGGRPEGVSGHRLSADQLWHVGRAARALDGDLHQAVRRLAAGHIDATAVRVRPTRGWDDLILDPDRMDRVREIAMRCRQRDVVFGEWGLSPQPSTGVVALFAGPSGTGKTLAAEVIAADLGVDVYKVDLANLVSKYIGETEKNLSAVFDAAEASNVALFFDEADALLGKRSEVSDAHDRYANIEVAYLLQRLERYEGLAIMATNLAKNIDPAFIRRLHVIVDFPVPEAAERRRIWARCLPKDAPLGDDLDLDALADAVEVAGGTIRNAVTTSAFLAADAGTPITMALAVAGLRRELQKIGRLIDHSTFAGLGTAQS